ncbi:MAG: NlpC/P60 family protein [Sarcina sp.]
MKKTAITCLLTLSMLTGISTAAVAAPATPSTTTAKANVEASKANVATQQKAFKDAQAQLASAQTNLEQISNEISNLTRQINENNVQINNNEQNLKVFTAEYQADLKAEAARIKSIYQNDNNIGVLPVILTSKNLGQVISRLYALNKLMQLDHQATEKTLNAKNSMDATQKTLNDLKASNEAKLTSLNAKKATAESLLTKMQSNVAYQQSQLEQAQATATASIKLLQEATTQAQVDNAVTALKHIASTTGDASIKSQVNTALDSSQTKLEQVKQNATVAPAKADTTKAAPAKATVAPAPKASSSTTTTTNTAPTTNTTSSAVTTNTNTTPATSNSTTNSVQAPAKQAPAASSSSADPSNGSVTGEDVVSYAMTCLGAPYVWGALGPNAFDCSGLTHYVYAHFGYQLGDDTYSQINDGTPVSTNVSDLQPGDLIFWGPANAPYHVAIYIGGGEYIAAPKPGGNVLISSWHIQDISGARRIL